MTLIWVLGTFAALAVAYVLARPYILARSPAWSQFCDRIDPLVVSWLSKSRQIAIARLAGLSGFMIAVMSTIGGIPIDWSMVGNWIVSFFPVNAQPFVEKIMLPVLIWAYGEIMRRATTQPLEAKE